MVAQDSHVYDMDCDTRTTNDTMTSGIDSFMNNLHTSILGGNVSTTDLLRILSREVDSKEYDCTPYVDLTISLVPSSNTSLLRVHYCVLYSLLCRQSPVYRSILLQYIHACGVEDPFAYFKSIDTWKAQTGLDIAVQRYVRAPTIYTIRKYVREVDPILSEWYRTPTKVTVWTRATKSNSTEVRTDIVKRFVQVAKQYAPISFTSSFDSGKRRKKQAKKETDLCKQCGGKIDQIEEICTECGKSYAKETETRASTDTSQLRTRLREIQCKTNFKLTDDMRAKLDPYLKKINTTSHSFKHMHIVYVRTALRASKLMKHSNNVWRIAYDYWPDKVVPISFDGYEDEIAEYYRKAQNTIRALEIKDSVNRNFLIYKIAELLGVPRIHEKLFPIPDQKAKYNAVWKRVCTANNWTCKW